MFDRDGVEKFGKPLFSSESLRLQFYNKMTMQKQKAAGSLQHITHVNFTLIYLRR